LDKSAIRLSVTEILGPRNMRVTSDGKWLLVDPPDVPVVAAAKEILAHRVADVEDALPRAARIDSDPDSVHQLRVSCRRAAAALRAFRPLVGRRGKKLDRWLKRLRRAAGPARDADVLLARLRRELDPSQCHARQVLAKVERARIEAQRRLAAVGAKAAHGRLMDAGKKCLKALRKVKGASKGKSFAEFAHCALTAAADDMLAIDAHHATFEELHQLRIAAKRLRYSIELFHSAVDPRLRTESYPVVEELQDRLGALNDRVAAQALFQSWLADMPPDGLAAFIASLVVAERAAAEAARRDLLGWCLPTRQAELLERLEALAD
jgi:CHAD domain-containing protein